MKYFKAYHLGDLRQFPHWDESVMQQSIPLPDETICYVWEDLRVVLNPFNFGEVFFESTSPQWQNFCKETLQFVIPPDVQPIDAEIRIP